MIEISPGVRISEHELSFSFDRSPGPGGQNVNKVNTRVTLHFDVAKSVSLSSPQKSRVQQALASRISRDGVLKISSTKERTQLANRRAAVSRLIELIAGAFDTPAARKKTALPASADAARLETKRRQSDLKRSRARVGGDN